MKFTVAIVLVVISISTADVPRPKILIAQQKAPIPYLPRGWRPSGPVFNLPQTTVPDQQQQQQQAQPPQTYGPPPVPHPSYGPPPEPVSTTTTEQSITTTDATTEENIQEPQAESFKVDPRTGKVPTSEIQKNEKLNSEAEQQTKKPATGQLFVVVPQGQNLLYTTSGESAPLVAALPRANLVAAPASPARLQIVTFPATSSLSSTSVFTPFSASYVQIFQ